ncbi:MAG: acetyl-CoA carboxylase, biotin carboxyl carrier protein, partial [Flavisolibacter sp.]
MDFKQIQELIKLVNDSNIGEVTIEQKDFKVTIKQKEEHITQMVAASMPAASFSQLPQQQPMQSLPGSSQQATTEKQAAQQPASNTIT